MGAKLKDQSEELDPDTLKAIKDAVDGVDLSKIFDNDEVDHDQLNIWIPTAHLNKYRNLQKLTKKKFGKALQVCAVLLIDKVDKLKAV